MSTLHYEDVRSHACFFMLLGKNELATCWGMHTFNFCVLRHFLLDELGYIL